MTDTFWLRFMEWHLRTDHPWDVALHMEAMSLSLAGLAQTLGEALRPALDDATASLRRLFDRLDAA